MPSSIILPGRVWWKTACCNGYFAMKNRFVSCSLLLSFTPNVNYGSAGKFSSSCPGGNKTTMDFPPIFDTKSVTYNTIWGDYPCGYNSGVSFHGDHHRLMHSSCGRSTSDTHNGICSFHSVPRTFRFSIWCVRRTRPNTVDPEGRSGWYRVRVGFLWYNGDYYPSMLFKNVRELRICFSPPLIVLNLLPARHIVVEFIEIIADHRFKRSVSGLACEFTPPFISCQIYPSSTTSCLLSLSEKPLDCAKASTPLIINSHRDSGQFFPWLHASSWNPMWYSPVQIPIIIQNHRCFNCDMF